MDLRKTGTLISSRRKEMGLTQKQLAEALHISDRTVSKWERGAGFPDVSLLEPLAAALGLHILDLLRGERAVPPDAHAAVSEAIAAFREKQRLAHGRFLRDLGKLALLLLAVGMLVSLACPVKSAVDQILPVGIYHDGVLIVYTDVEIRGEIEHTLVTGQRLYCGRFAIACIPWTAGEEVIAEIYLDRPGGLGYVVQPGIPSHRLYDPSTVMSRDMREFAFEIRCDDEGWYILASSPAAYQAYCAQRQALRRWCLRPWSRCRNFRLFDTI